MLRHLSSAAALVLLLLAARASLAAPVTLTILAGNTDGLKFSHLHDATQAPATIDGNEFLRGGDMFRLSGTLTGDLVGSILTIDAGTLFANGIDDVDVLGGQIAFPGPDPDDETNAYIGTLRTSNYDTFSFFDNQSVLHPAAQTFVGDTIILWGNNWEGPLPGSGERFGIDLGIRIEAPEAATSLLLGSALAGLAVMGRRRQS